MTIDFTGFVVHYGYLAVFCLVLPEGLGLPFPGETALLSGAAFAAGGRLSIEGVVLAATIAAILGDNGGYWIGRTGGLSFVRRYGRIFRLRESSLDRARAFFERHGAKTVFIARFVALLRIWAGVLAGVSRMSYARFVIFNALGAACWATTFGTLGYIFGRSLPKVHRTLGRVGLALALLIALVVFLALVWRWTEDHRREIWAWMKRFGERLAARPALRRLAESHPGIWRVVAERFTPGEYLGLHLTIGLACSLAALLAFAAVTEGVMEPERLTHFDVALADVLHAHATPAGVALATHVSQLGSVPVLTALMLGVAFVLILLRRPMLVGGWLAAALGAGLIAALLKVIIRRPRPLWPDPFAYEPTFSFPSGHAIESLAIYGMLGYLLILALRRRALRIAVGVLALILVLALGFARLYLGLHYFSDVVGGYAAGAVWLAACISGLEVLRARGAVPAADADR